MRDFSEILRQLRKEKKISQKALGEVLGIRDRNIRFTKAGTTGQILMACCNGPTTFRYHWTIW